MCLLRGTDWIFKVLMATTALTDRQVEMDVVTTSYCKQLHTNTSVMGGPGLRLKQSFGNMHQGNTNACCNTLSPNSRRIPVSLLWRFADRTIVRKLHGLTELLQKIPKQNFKLEHDCSASSYLPLITSNVTDNISQQDFGTRKFYCVSNVTFHAESKYAIKIFPSPTGFVQWPF